MLQAEERRAPTAKDLAVIRSGARSEDPQTRRIAVRALGRLERPTLIPDIVPSLRHALPEIRSEAANAIGQAAQGWKGHQSAVEARALDGAVGALVARLKIEAEPDVRAAICETIGRLPYSTAEQVSAAERTLIDTAARAESVSDRLGVAKGFEALVRLHQKIRLPSEEALALLSHLATRANGDASSGARVRRLALETLASAAAVDDEVLRAAAQDRDPQARRLAMRAAATTNRASKATAAEVLKGGLADPSALVRLEALRGDRSCNAAIAAVSDRNMHVVLLALDGLGRCGSVPDAIAYLEHTVDDLSQAASPRGWHRAAHALVALASAAPDRGAAKLPQFTGSRVWQLRMYAARAATTLTDRVALETLATDGDDNVREAAVGGLQQIAGHDADAVYVSALARPGYQVVRAAALALDGTPHPDVAVPALKAALQRLTAEGRDNSRDAREAIERALTSLGDRQVTGRGQVGDRRVTDRGQTPRNELNAEDLRRLASPRARVTIRGVGTFELALFTAEAPATVLHFAHLAQAGYYNGLTFHRVVLNFVIQGGSPGANEFIGDAAFMRDEVGLWPHVRGAVGISTRGHDTGDAQIFIDLVDNPRLDHVYTAFAQVLNGIDVVDQILEGDVIDTIEIIP